MTREGRKSYRRELGELRKTVSRLGRGFDDGGRIERIRRCLEGVLGDLDAVDAVKGL